MNIEEKPVTLKDLDLRALFMIGVIAEAWSRLRLGREFFVELSKAVNQEVDYRENKPNERRPLFVISLDPLSNSQLSQLEIFFSALAHWFIKEGNVFAAKFCLGIVDAAGFEEESRRALRGSSTLN